MRDFLFEVYTEEIPATLLNDLTHQFKELAINKLKEFNLPYSEIESFGTPRRLVLFIKNVEEEEKPKVVEIKGPPYKIAYDENGNKTEVFSKFLESNNLLENEVQIREIKGNKYLFGVKKIEGRRAQEVLKEVAIFVLKSLTFKRGMRWNSSNVFFIRPIRSLLLLYGDEVLEIEYAGIKSGDKSYGFFFDSPMEFKVENTNDYFKKLREKYVVLDFKERKEIVLKGIQKLANSVNGKVKFEEDFLEEVVNLTEFPTPFLCDLRTENINVPDCIIESVVKDHLKSFPVLSSDGKKLLPYFIGVRNGTSDFIENVKKGYEKVAKARLYDGSFFFKEDQKEPLEKRIEQLKDIVFIKGLGTLYDKTMRLVKIAEFLGKAINLDGSQLEKLLRASYLSKADITTQVVKEFPELQGVIGEIYAALQGEDPQVCKAIREQYLPKNIEDEVPQSEVGKLLSIIDKLDTLVVSISSNIEFSASKDPFGLRKNALQIVQVALSLNRNSFPLTSLIEYIEDLVNSSDKKSTSETVINLLRERANYFIKANKISYDNANAVTTLPIDDLPTFLDRAKVLEKHSTDEKFKQIVITHKRIRNILDKSKDAVREIRQELLFDKAELDLYESALETEKLLLSLLSNRDYEAIIQLLYLFVPIVNTFFDNVLVMDNNEDVRVNRLSLLNKVRSIFEKFANFSEIVIEG